MNVGQTELKLVFFMFKISENRKLGVFKNHREFILYDPGVLIGLSYPEFHEEHDFLGSDNLPPEGKPQMGVFDNF